MLHQRSTTKDVTSLQQHARPYASLSSKNKENSHRAMSFNPNASDSVSNQTSSRRVRTKAEGQAKPGSSKKNTTRLYQRYRKLYEVEKKEKE